MNPRFLLILATSIPLLTWTGCEKHQAQPSIQTAASDITEPLTGVPLPGDSDLSDSVVRINATLQSWNTWQPWEKNEPARRRALGAIVAPGLVLTTAEMAANAIFLELESTDGTRFLTAKVYAIDYESNLALLKSNDESAGDTFFANTRPIPIADLPSIGDAFEILQVEANGSLLQTTGKLQSVDLTAPMVPSGGFLTYLVKASMQDAASSYSLPVMRDGKLAGILFSYDSKDQICEISSTEIIGRFLESAKDGSWEGFPYLGVATANTEDTSLRQWLKLHDDHGGIYVGNVRKKSAAAAAGIVKGDVILAIDGIPIDRRGYCKHPSYGNLSWGHWVRGRKIAGDSVGLSVWREGAAQDISVTLIGGENSSQLVPIHMHDQAPNFLVKGGLVFQELTLPILNSFGKDWRSTAPLDLLNAMENPEAFEGRAERIVFLSGVVPTPATIGYEQLRNLIVQRVNGREIKNLADLADAFDSHKELLHSIEFASESLTIHLDESVSTRIDGELLQRGIRKLSRTDNRP